MSEDEAAPVFRPTERSPYREPPGEDISRILSLSDGIFAFAMTLLVVNLTGLGFLTCGSSADPCSSSPLSQQILGNSGAYLGYATVFLVIGLYWVVHHRTYRYIERYDSALIWLNLLFLMCIAAMPFVLEVVNKYAESPAAIVLMSVVAAAAGGMIGAIWWHASGRGHLMDPRLDPKVASYFRRRGLILPAIFLLAIPIAFVAPDYAPVVWILAIPASLTMRRYGAA